MPWSVWMSVVLVEWWLLSIFWWNTIENVQTTFIQMRQSLWLFLKLRSSEETFTSDSQFKISSPMKKKYLYLEFPIQTMTFIKTPSGIYKYCYWLNFKSCIHYPYVILPQKQVFFSLNDHNFWTVIPITEHVHKYKIVLVSKILICL